MDRASIFFLDKNDANTYDDDEQLPPLPLPSLHDTLQRYYESLKPFGTPAELANSLSVIKQFEAGIGAELHAKLQARAAREKNWVDELWDKYAYHMLRLPLNPYIVMAMPVKLEDFGIPETPARLLKNLSRITYHTLEFWEMLHKATLKPLTSNGGKVKYSSALYKRFFSTTRAPGLEYDHIKKYFKTVAEGTTPTHCLISGKGRLFLYDCLRADGTLVTQQEILVLLQRVRSILDYEPMGDCVPVLTHDERTGWAKNYQHLQEISANNRKTIELIESSALVVVFDEHEPQNQEEIVRVITTGDFHSKWGDRSSTIIAFKSGRFAYVGEHSAYDGTVSVSYAIYVQMSIFETDEPDWDDLKNVRVTPLTELQFDLDDTIRGEIERVQQECDERRTHVMVTHDIFHEYGKDVIKTFQLHPDSYIQVIMQLAYAEMHNEIAPTYETALMRHYYNGRTETLRSCTSEVYKFIQVATSPNASKTEVAKAFRTAVEHHNYMMNEARKGHGVDRHLFGLWCVAYENQIEIPDFYADPLYMKSGGGGNFVLSTSTLGYSMNVGFVGPMTLDGYGVFYTICPENIYIQVTAFQDSTKTSAHKFNEIFKQTFHKVRTALEEEKKHSKL